MSKKSESLEYYLNLESWDLYDAILLVLRLLPSDKYINIRDWDNLKKHNHRRRLFLEGQRAAVSGDLPYVREKTVEHVTHYYVNPNDFLNWANSRGFSTPEYLAHLQDSTESDRDRASLQFVEENDKYYWKLNDKSSGDVVGDELIKLGVILAKHVDTGFVSHSDVREELNIAGASYDNCDKRLIRNYIQRLNAQVRSIGLKISPDEKGINFSINKYLSVIRN